MRLNRTLWPEVAGNSLWESWNTLYQLQMAKLNAIWLSMDSDPKKWRTQYQANWRAFSQHISSDTSDVPTSPAVSTTTSTLSTSTLSKALRGESPFSLPLPSLPQPSQDLQKATRVFRRSFTGNSAPPLELPRGTILVFGMVELTGNKAIAVMDIQAAYDPAKSRYVSINVTARRAARRELVPKPTDEE